MEGIESVLKTEVQNIILYIEYMDTKRIFTKEYFQQLYGIYKLKYSNQKIDLIICSDNYAFEFLLKYHNDLFVHTPIVFCGIEVFDGNFLSPTDAERITGVIEKCDTEKTIDIALKLHPKSRHIVVISDSSSSGMIFAQELKQKIIPKFRGLTRFSFWNNLTMEELLKKVEKLSDGSIILLWGFVKDKSGTIFNPKESTILITEASGVPVYCNYEGHLNYGVVGGMLMNPFFDGKAAAEIALRVLHGEKIKSIPVQRGANRYMFNYEQLKRWGIKLSDLPENSIVINQPYSFFKEHKKLTFGVALFIIFQTLIIIVLVVNRLRRRQAEEALLDSEERYHGIFDSATDSFVIFDLNGFIVEANPQACEMYGYSYDNLIGLSSKDIIHSDYCYFFEQFKRDVLSEGKFYAESVDVRKDGAAFNVEVKGAGFNYKGDLCLLAVIRDITERKKAEAAIYESKIKLQVLYDSSSDAIMLLDKKGFFDCNKAALRLFGCTTKEEFCSRHPADFSPQAQPDGIDSMTYASNNIIFALKEGSARFEHLHRRLDNGTDFPAQVLLDKMVLNGKEVLQARVFDITERRKVEKELEEYQMHLEKLVNARTRELEAANKELEAFSYSVSHDLRAPLRSMDGFSQLILKKYADKLDAQGKDYLARIKNASLHMAQLIEDMLQLARVTRKEIKRERIDLSRLAQDLIVEFQQTDQERRVEVNIQPRVIAVGDKELLRVVLQNLLENAWKFSKNNPAAYIEFGTKQVKEEKQYFVCDNGVGFDVKYRDKLFGVFQRLHSESEFPGTGVGLATVERIIRKHGGCVWAESELGKGAVFYFTLAKF